MHIPTLQMKMNYKDVCYDPSNRELQLPCWREDQQSRKKILNKKNQFLSNTQLQHCYSPKQHQEFVEHVGASFSAWWHHWDIMCYYSSRATGVEYGYSNSLGESRIQMKCNQRKKNKDQEWCNDFWETTDQKNYGRMSKQRNDWQGIKSHQTGSGNCTKCSMSFLYLIFPLSCFQNSWKLMVWSWLFKSRDRNIYNQKMNKDL